MKDSTLIALLSARRLVQKQADFYQEDTSKKMMKVPQHALEQLMEATRQILLEELET